jgi:hypothetical protein
VPCIAIEKFWFSSTLLINSFEPWVIIVVISLLELWCHFVFTDIVGELLFYIYIYIFIESPWAYIFRVFLLHYYYIEHRHWLHITRLDTHNFQL